MEEFEKRRIKELIAFISRSEIKSFAELCDFVSDNNVDFDIVLEHYNFFIAYFERNNSEWW